MTITETFFKQIYKYTHPKIYQHNQNLWPFCKISRAISGEINFLIYKNKKIKLVSLTNLHKAFNGSVLLIATGPSVKEIDFFNLPKINVFGVNGAYHLKNKISFDLYMIIDMNFIDKKIELLKIIIADNKIILFTTLQGIIRIINKFKLSSINCQLALIENICYRNFFPSITKKKMIKHFLGNTSIYFAENNFEIAFTTDIRIGIFDAGTVTFWALQVIIFLGFEQLYLIGLDMNNFDKPRFYETKENMLPSYLKNKITNIIIPAFDLASKVFKKHGILVKNLSLNSALHQNIFEKKSYNDIFGKNYL